MTVNEAAQCLSIGRPKMWQLVMTGEVLSIKIGASRRISVAALEAYVQRLCGAAEEDLQRREISR
jgi:excisionase family DNA binding protein